jgi:EmrB/QacA subfamily drug resistance transporter
MAQTTTAPQAAPTTGAALTGAGLFALLFAASLSSLDMFIVNVALATIGADLGASDAALELVVAGYGTAYASLLVLGGRIGDRFGRRRVLLWGLAGFGAASLLCGLAPSPGLLVAARVLQGATAALMFPQSMATIQAATSGPQKARALGLFGSIVGLAMAVGQVLGGFMVGADLAGTGWRSVFLVNVPMVVIAVLLVRRTVPDTRAQRSAPLDPLGSVLLGAALVALLAPLTEGRAAGWPVWAWASLAAFPVLAAAFFTVQRRGERAGGVPLLPPSLLALQGFRRALPMLVLSVIGFTGFLFTASVAFQQGLGYGPVDSGWATVPYALAFFAGSAIGPRIAARHDARVLRAGLAIQAVGVALAAWAVAVAWNDAGALALAPGIAVAGLGQGLQMPVLMRLILAEAPPERAGVASGAMGTAQQVSGAVGVALLGALFLHLAPHVGIGAAFAWTLAAQGATILVNLALSVRIQAG